MAAKKKSWYRTLMRWGFLLSLCYVATLLQLSLVERHKHQNDGHPHEEMSYRLATLFGIGEDDEDWKNNETVVDHANSTGKRQRRRRRRRAKPARGIPNDISLPDDMLQTSCLNSQDRRVTIPQIPTFIIGGTQKGGTTALQKLIKMHPLIVDSVKFEGHFFDYDETMRGNAAVPHSRLFQSATLCDLREKYAREYFPLTKLMRNSQLLSFEKTPAYILDESTPAKIKAITPWAKVIFSLRNPIDRAFSHYKMLRTRKQLPETDQFENVLALDLAVLRARQFNVAAGEPFPVVEKVNQKRMHHLWKQKNLVYRGLYADQLRPWLQHNFTIGRNLMVVQFERMLEHPHDVLDEILDFLGVHRHSYDQAHFNESYSPVVAHEDHVLKDATRDYLLRLYEPYNRQLVEMLGEQWRGVWNSTHY